MAKFQFNGVVPTVFPTLGLTVAAGDVFEAPDGFTATDVTPSKGKVTAVSDADPTLADATPAVEAPAVVDAPVTPPTTSDAPTSAETPIETAPAATN